MSVRLHSRRAHTRRYRNGKLGFVCASVVTNSEGSNEPGKRWATTCPRCGARIIIVRMPNGGWARYEAGRGMSRIKHACFDRGVGFSKGSENDTLPLFPIDDLGHPLKRRD